MTDSDFEERLKNRVLAYEKKIETQLLQNKYKTLITALTFALIICIIIAIIGVLQAKSRHYLLNLAHRCKHSLIYKFKAL